MQANKDFIAKFILQCFSPQHYSRISVLLILVLNHFGANSCFQFKKLKMKLHFAKLLIALMVLSSSFLQFILADSIDCGSKCGVRCSKSGRPKLCLKYCNICCQKCNCVPSGTYGNKAECPCYNNMLNSKGKPKCP